MAMIKALPCLLLAVALLCGQVLAQDEEPVVAIAKDITIGEVRAAVTGSDGSSAFSTSGSSPAVLLHGQKLSGSQTLEVSFSPRSGGLAFKPQQVMLHLSHPASGASAYAVGKTKKDGSYSISISSALIEKQIGKQGGAFDVTLLVGDPSVPSGVSYPLGSLELPAVSGSPATPTVRTAALQPLTNTKPEIEHLHRSAQKRPPAIVSLVFTALIGAPLLGAIVAVLAYGGNLKAFPTGLPGLSAILFHGALLAFIGLYVLFWLRLNLMETLPLALGLGVVLFVTGHFALRGIAAARLKKD